MENNVNDSNQMNEKDKNNEEKNENPLQKNNDIEEKKEINDNKENNKDEKNNTTSTENTKGDDNNKLDNEKKHEIPNNEINNDNNEKKKDNEVNLSDNINKEEKQNDEKPKEVNNDIHNLNQEKENKNLTEDKNIHNDNSNEKEEVKEKEKKEEQIEGGLKNEKNENNENGGNEEPKKEEQPDIQTENLKKNVKTEDNKNEKKEEAEKEVIDEKKELKKEEQVNNVIMNKEENKENEKKENVVDNNIENTNDNSNIKTGDIDENKSEVKEEEEVKKEKEEGEIKEKIGENGENENSISENKEIIKSEKTEDNKEKTEDNKEKIEDNKGKTEEKTEEEEDEKKEEVKNDEIKSLDMNENKVSEKKDDVKEIDKEEKEKLNEKKEDDENKKEEGIKEEEKKEDVNENKISDKNVNGEKEDKKKEDGKKEEDKKEETKSTDINENKVSEIKTDNKEIEQKEKEKLNEEKAENDKKGEIDLKKEDENKKDEGLIKEEERKEDEKEEEENKEKKEINFLAKMKQQIKKVKEEIKEEDKDKPSLKKEEEKKEEVKKENKENKEIKEEDKEKQEIKKEDEEKKKSEINEKEEILEYNEAQTEGLLDLLQNKEENNNENDLVKYLEEQERKKREEEEEIKKKEEELKRLEEERKQREIENRKLYIKSYAHELDNLLEEINNQWNFGDKNNFADIYENKYYNDMNKLFNEINNNEQIKDEIIVLVYKFLCDYYESRKNYLRDIPWIEVVTMRKILNKDNFTICILNNNQLLIDCFLDLLKTYNIEKKDNIIEYNGNDFIKYLMDFMFRNKFIELYIDNVITREDENFFCYDNYIYDNTKSFMNELISILCYPLEAIDFCEKEYILKNNLHENYINKFLSKIDIILKSSIKEDIKKTFYNMLIDKYVESMRYMYHKIINDIKDKNIQFYENFANFATKIGEFYLLQQKLELRINGLNIITQIIEIIQNHIQNQPETIIKIFLYIKECVIKYITKINIYNLIFGENIHEALVHRAYTLLSFLYKNKAFKPEQIKHLWNLSQDKYQTISDNIISLFGKLLPEFSTNDSNAILKIVSEMNLSEVNEVTLKLLENFFNSNEKNEKLYNILYKLSDELTFNEGLSKNIIYKSRTILVKLLFNQNYVKDLINIIKKCIFNIGKNYLVNTSLSLLKLILEEFYKKQDSIEVKKIFNEINPQINNVELLIQYLEKKGTLFSVLFTNLLDNAKLMTFLLEETKNLKQIIKLKENFDSELTLKLDELYKKFINPENGYYYNYGLNDNAPEQIINNPPIRQVSSNQLDKTQSTEKSLNEALIENEEDIEGNNNNNIINNIEELFNNEDDHWEFVINPEKYFKNIFKEYILFIKNISLKNNNIFISEEELIDCLFNQFEFPFSNKNYYQNINDLLETILSFWVMGKIQINIGTLDFFYQITIKNGVTNQEKILYYKFLNNILKKQVETKNIILLSDKVLKDLILEKNVKYDSVSINQLPYEAFEFFKQFFIYFNEKHGNISYSNKKINSIENYDLIVGLHILENYYIYSNDNKIYHESLEIITNILNIFAQNIKYRQKILDKYFELLKKNKEKIKNDNEIKNYIIRILKIISIINSTKVINKLDPNDPENMIEIKVRNNYFNEDTPFRPLQVFKGIKVKDLKNEITNKIILTQETLDEYSQSIQINLHLDFDLNDLREQMKHKELIIKYKDYTLQDELTIYDYDIEKDDCLIVYSGQNINLNKECELSEEKLKEGYEQINGIFNGMHEKELIILALKKHNGNVENTIMYLTEEGNIEDLKKEIERNKKEEQQKKVVHKKEEEIILPLEEVKINLLFDILNEEDNTINDEIWKLFSEIKYPDSIINKATGVELVTVISEPNLYKMLLNLKLVNSLVFDDKFCKYNTIPIDIKSNWVSKFITNESFVTTILNKLNDIGQNSKSNSNSNSISNEKEKDKEKDKDSEKDVLKLQILSIFTNWFHNIFINMINVIKNKYIESIIKDIVLCKEFTLHNNNNINIVKEMQNNNANNANNNNQNNANAQVNQIEMINENEAKGFINVLHKNNIVLIFYKVLKTALSFNRNNKNIITSILEMLLIYFSINKESIKTFLEEEKKYNSIVQSVICDKNKGLRLPAFNFLKILVKNLNNYEKKKKKKKIIEKKDENINKNDENNNNKEIKDDEIDKKEKKEKEVKKNEEEKNDFEEKQKI